MQTILEDMRSGISEEGIRLGGEILKQGGLVAFPTETVYGLGGNALDAEAGESDCAGADPGRRRLCGGSEREYIRTSEPDKGRACGRGFKWKN